MSHIPAQKMDFISGIGWKTIISLIIMYTTSFAVGQEAIQKYFAAKDEKTAVLGSLLAALIFCVFAFIPAILGVIAYGEVLPVTMFTHVAVDIHRVLLHM